MKILRISSRTFLRSAFSFCSTVKKLVIILEKYQKIWYNIIDYNRLP